jgi:hypothetical protein
MASITDAIIKLGINDWALNGEPTSESEFNSGFSKITGADSEGMAIVSTDPSDFGVTWKQVSDKLKELNDAEPLGLLRKTRNEMLVESDWMANSDVTMSDAWKTYRQSLRDITDSATSLDDVTWPTKPS